MKRFLALTLILAAVQLVVGTAVNYGIFRKVDLRFAVLLSLMTVAPFQAAVVMWVRRDPAARPLLAVPQLLRNRLAIALGLADLIILALVLIVAPHTLRIFFGAHSLFAAFVFLTLPARVASRDRWIVLLTAAGLALYGISGFWDWLALIPGLMGRSTTVLRWIAAYVPLFVVALVVLLRTASAFRTRSLAAAGWVELAVGLLLLAAVVIASNIFFRPYLVEPWKTIEHVLAWTSVTAMMLSALACFKAGDAVHAT